MSLPDRIRSTAAANDSENGAENGAALAPSASPNDATGSIVQIVQIVPVAAGGVLDCADVLQQHWAASGQLSTCIALEEAAAVRRPLAWQLLSSRTGLSGVSIIGPVLALLHYSGYGYQARGLPYWLLREIDAARRHLPGGLRLGVYFHELHASGPPWRSAFWLGGLQARLGRQLARRAEALWTNTEAHGTWLRRMLGASGPEVTVCPVPSTIGEPAANIAAAPREPVAAVFGAPSTRARALHGAARHAAELRRHGVQRLLEVGPGPATAVVVDGLAVDFRGCLSATNVSALLAECRYGLIDYPSDMLGKSSVFAALAAHGLTVLNTRAPGADADGLRRETHYLALGTGASALASSDRCAVLGQAACRWYAPHRAAVQAARMARVLRAAGATPWPPAALYADPSRPMERSL